MQLRNCDSQEAPRGLFMRRYVDLSICIENEIISDPPFAIPEITYMDHSQTIGRMQHFFPELEPGNLPEEAAWAIERIKLTTHNGTHMDAPYHFHPTMNHDLVEGGEPAATIDEIPLDWCYRPGVKLDFRHLPDGYVVTAQDVEEELARIDWQLSP